MWSKEEKQEYMRKWYIKTKPYRQTAEFKIKKRMRDKAWDQDNKDKRRNYKLYNAYGITLNDKIAIYDKQQGICPICKNWFAFNKLVVDHEHIKGYKHLPPELKRKYIRGLLCWIDNLYCVGKNTLPKARLVVSYLEIYENNKIK